METEDRRLLHLSMRRARQGGEYTRFLLRISLVVGLLIQAFAVTLRDVHRALAANPLCSVSLERGCILVPSADWNGVDVKLNKVSDTKDEFWLSPNSGDYGYEWQCVELIQRFYAQVLYKDDADYQAKYKKWGGNAIDLWTNYPKNKDITPIANDGKSLAAPQWGDVLVFDDGYDSKGKRKPGHVAIVTGVSGQGKARRVYFVEQNTGVPTSDKDGNITSIRATGKDSLPIAENNYVDEIDLNGDKKITGDERGWLSANRPTIVGWLHSSRKDGTTVAPGTTVTKTTTVVTPLIPAKPDIVFLADTTGSMGDAIDNVRTKAATIMQEVRAIHADARFGVAEYKDFNCDASPYLLDQAITANTADVQTGINKWSANGGCDTPEAQLNALYRLSTDIAGTGWGTNTNRVVVWFGDAPGHDPSNGHSLSATITVLKAAKIRVLAISTGYNDLDGCAESCQQATAIATATGGKFLSTVSGASVSSVPDNANTTPRRPSGASVADDDVAAAIVAGLKSLPTTVTPQINSGSPYVTIAIDPPSMTVTSGETVTFTVTITVSKDIPPGTTVNPQLDFLLDGKPVADAAVTTPILIAVPVLRTLMTSATGGGSISLMGGTYIDSTPVVLTATAQAGYIFTGWLVDGQTRGWVNPLPVIMDNNHTVQATFVAVPSFSDVPAGDPASVAIIQLAARGVINGYGDGRFGLADQTLRAQMAALIVRAMGWRGESADNHFNDRNGVDDELWLDVAILAARDVARGYGDGTYGTLDDVLNAQVISFVTRGMVAKGYWQYQPDDGKVYPNIPANSGHRIDVATYAHYAGALPDFPDTSVPFPYWDLASTREWFARVLWQALDSYLGIEQQQEGFAGP